MAVFGHVTLEESASIRFKPTDMTPAGNVEFFMNDWIHNHMSSQTETNVRECVLPVEVRATCGLIFTEAWFGFCERRKNENRYFIITFKS